MTFSGPGGTTITLSLVIFGAILAVVAVVIFLYFCIQAIFLLWGARIANIKERSFGKALGTTFFSAAASVALSPIIRLSPGFGRIGEVIGSVLIAVLIMREVFSTTFGKALVATVFAWVIGIVILVGLTVLCIVVLGGLALSYVSSS